MKKAINIISLALALLLLFSGCSKQSDVNSDTPADSAEPVTHDFAKTPEEMFTDRDFEIGYDVDTAIRIELNEDNITCSSDSVTVSGTTATITKEATYIVEGALNDGQIIVEAPENAKLQIVLSDATVHCSFSAPLYIKEADKVFVTLATGTSNSLTGGGESALDGETTVDGSIFSKQDLTINGEGSLTVTSPAFHGIVCKDDLVITGGNYTVTSASHGLDANDSIRMANASITIDAGKDGMHAENNDDSPLGFVYFAGGNMTISAEGDGISAGAYMQIDDGSFSIVTGGGSENSQKTTSDSYGGFMGGGPPSRPSRPSSSSSSSSTESGESIKGLKAASGILIGNGSFTINSADDSLHSNADLTINGGSYTISAGDDALHADETLTVTSAIMNISESYEGIEGLHVKIMGGNVTLNADDDGINAAGGTDSSGYGGGRGDMFGSSSSKGSIEISGGTLNITASGDGLDANGTLSISGGYITVCGPNTGDTATLDYDVSGIITGGTFIGTGASGMAQTFSQSNQGVISVSVGSISAQTPITLSDKDGNVILSATPQLAYSVVILSSPSIKSGETFVLTVGTTSKEFKAS